ncbi:MAG: DUF790 family protein [Methanotrichaceae archaeon]
MLTSDLLITRVHSGEIEPIYANLDPESLDVAGSVIDAFERNIGRAYGELSEELNGLEEINYRFVRGLAQILERRCIIDKDSIIDPVAARKAVFKESRGFVSSKEERTEVLKKAALALTIKPDDLEKALWADIEENLVVKEFQKITPEELLKQYNLSLVQTLLFRAAGMEIWIEDNYQQVFRRIKQLGLMYSIADGKIFLNGPISLFKLTEKYGTSFAKLLPTIMLSTRWSLKAAIIRKTSQGKRIYDFTLDHTMSHIFDAEPGINGRVDFDSAIEKDFYNLGFNGWTVEREPTVLKAGKYAFIPDFSLEKNGTKIYVEIIGFWTPEYLRNKIKKINQLEEKERIILLIDRNLACSGSEFKTENLIFYDRKIPQLEIIKILRRYDEKHLMDDISKLKEMEISIDGNMSVISLDDLAERYGVSLDALKEAIKGKDKIDYQLLGDQLVSNKILQTIEGELGYVKKHNDALKIFDKYGIKAHSQALKSLGYKVRWNGLSPEDADISRA